jgi:6-phosphofructokinase
MGRSSGFIAAHATLASGDVDLCLLPEMPIILNGPRGCLPHLMRRVTKKGKNRNTLKNDRKVGCFMHNFMLLLCTLCL